MLESDEEESEEEEEEEESEEEEGEEGEAKEAEGGKASDESDEEVDGAVDEGLVTPSGLMYVLWGRMRGKWLQSDPQYSGLALQIRSPERHFVGRRWLGNARIH